MHGLVVDAAYGLELVKGQGGVDGLAFVEERIQIAVQKELPTHFPVRVGLGVAAGALGTEGPFNRDPAFVSLLESRLKENLPKRAARAIIKFIRDLPN